MDGPSRFLTFSFCSSVCRGILSFCRLTFWPYLWCSTRERQPSEELPLSLSGVYGHKDRKNCPYARKNWAKDSRAGPYSETLQVSLALFFNSPRQFSQPYLIDNKSLGMFRADCLHFFAKIAPLANKVEKVWYKSKDRHARHHKMNKRRLRPGAACRWAHLVTTDGCVARIN